jgi:hypothetical protein
MVCTLKQKQEGKTKSSENLWRVREFNEDLRNGEYLRNNRQNKNFCDLSKGMHPGSR